MVSMNLKKQTMVVAVSFLFSFLSSGVYAQFSVLPTNVTSVIEGNSLTLQCSYVTATQITWQREEQTISQDDPNYDITEITPSISNLTLSSANRLIHNGSYGCIATTTTNTTETTPFIVIVVYLDVGVQVIISQTDECANGIIYDRSSVTLECVIPGAFPAPQVSWYHNGNRIPDINQANIVFSSLGRSLVFSGILTSQSGEWMCVADNGVEVISLPTIINIQDTSIIARTVMIEAPANNLVFVKRGEYTTLSCLFNPPLTGDEKQTVIWTVDSGGIRSGERGYSLVRLSCSVLLRIDSVDTFHEGTYRCSFDGTTSQAVELDIATIHETYSVTISPSSPIGKGKQVEFRCQPQGDPGNNPESISWRFLSSSTGATSDLTPDGRLLVQEEGMKFVITEARVEDTGTYSCVASNPLTAEVITNLELVVEDLPPITITPPNPTVKIGTSLTLTCDVVSPRTVSLSWNKDGNRITDTAGRYRITDSPPSSTLEILAMQESDLGNITCTGDDPVHFPVYATSNLVENTMFYLYGDKTYRNFTLEQNMEFRLDCDVRGGGVTSTVMWFKGNKEIPFIDRPDDFTITSFRNGTSSLVKPAASLEDESGDYQCKVVHEGLTLSQKFNILILIPGAFETFPPPFTNATVNRRFQLDCTVSGRPVPAIAWLFRGEAIASLNRSSIQDLGNGSLVFNPVSKEDAGTYVCSIKTPSFTFKETTLVVSDPNDMTSFIMTVEEAIVFAVVLVVAIILLLIAAFLVTVVLIRQCNSRNSKNSGSYDVNQDLADSGFMRQPSIRDRKDNSGILSQSPSNDFFDTLQKSPEMTDTFRYSDARFVSNADTAQLGLYGEGRTSNLALSEKLPDSYNSTPLHAAAYTSMYSSEDHDVSVTGSLPNFPRSNLELGDVMGEGEFGPVVLGVANHIVSTQDKTLVAVKVLLPREEDDEGPRPDLAMVDFANQMKLEYSNIASILGICSDMEPYYVIYEYLDQGDLKKFLHHAKPDEGDPPSLTPNDMHKMILQVADGMAWLFSQRIIHGDLATRNCLVSSSLQVKIADLGIGHDLYNHDYFDNGAQLLPIRWMPPELLEQMEDSPSFSLHSDIWSFGVVCWEVFAYAKLPYESYSDDELLTIIPTGSRLRKPSLSCPHALYDLMSLCWDENPDRRPQFASLCVAIVDLNLDQYIDFSQ